MLYYAFARIRVFALCIYAFLHLRVLHLRVLHLRVLHLRVLHFARELRLLRAVSVDLHMCAYDAAWLKPNRVVGTLPGISRMERRRLVGVPRAS
jgi:hypothetical protein